MRDNAVPLLVGKVRNFFVKNRARSPFQPLGVEGYTEALGLFDKDYYIRNNPDVAQAGRDPFAHYIEHGWKEGRDPSPSFSTSYYLSINSDVAASGQCPLLHYAKYGLSEQRSTRPGDFRDSVLLSKNESSHLSEGNTESASLALGLDTPASKVLIPDYLKDELLANFDESFYRAQLRAHEPFNDALQHYLDRGWELGALPNKSFDAKDYLTFNPDVAASKVHPFIHYVAAGKSEGRPCLNRSKNEKLAIFGAMPNKDRARLWGKPINPAGIRKDIFVAKIKETLPAVKYGLVLSLSHDNYLKSTGGVQIYLADEQRAFNEAGWCYLQASPVVPLPGLSDNLNADEFLFDINMNGDFIGFASAATLALAIAILRKEYRFGAHIVIHSLLGSSPTIARHLCKMISPHQTYFFVHDFSALCSNFTLLRNDNEFCGAPSLSSTACGVCVYGAERKASLTSYAEFFRAVTPQMVFPSHAAQQLWERRNPFALANEALVFEHAAVVDEGLEAASDLPDDGDLKKNEAINVAFVGFPSRYKGWEQFRALSIDLIGNKGFQLFAFSRDNPSKLSSIKHVPVAVDGSNRQAMIGALKSHSIDVVVMWSLCYETFSFTTLESIASGAFILARRGSGNVDVLVEQYEAGRLFWSFDDLIEYMRDDAFEVEVAAYRGRSRRARQLVVTNNFAEHVVERVK